MIHQCEYQKKSQWDPIRYLLCEIKTRVRWQKRAERQAHDPPARWRGDGHLRSARFRVLPASRRQLLLLVVGYTPPRSPFGISNCLRDQIVQSQPEFDGKNARSARCTTPPMGWLNELAYMNISANDVTILVLRPLTGWLNAEAFLNIRSAVVHLPVEQSPPSERGELNALAPLNMSEVLHTSSSPTISTRWLNTESTRKESSVLPDPSWANPCCPGVRVTNPGRASPHVSSEATSPAAPGLHSPGVAS